jgi:ubiquinone/menaquinone biosynthesis C-methylase UbiE
MDTPVTIRQPRTDDSKVWDVTCSIVGGVAVLAAFKLGLFSTLATGPRTIAEVCEALKLESRAAEALLSVCAAAGFVRLRNGKYSLTPVAEDYLLESSPTYSGAFWQNIYIAMDSWYTVGTVVKAAQTNSPQVYGGQEWVQAHDEQASLAQAFTRSMHSASMAPATAWPSKLDLSRYRVMLDLGGGSGAHCIGALSKWPRLQATVFDIAPVCEVAREIAAQCGLQDRFSTHTGDIWTDPFPHADLHFYSMIYHDWPPEKCRFLTEKSFASLPRGGRIVIHEMLFNDERSAPYATAAVNIVMLLWTTGRQYSEQELTKMLKDAGFQQIENKPSFGYWSVVTGIKP